MHPPDDASSIWNAVGYSVNPIGTVIGVNITVSICTVEFVYEDPILITRTVYVNIPRDIIENTPSVYQ